MSFNTKRASRRLSSSKPKTASLSNFTVNDLPSLRRKRTVAINRMSKAYEVGLLAKDDDTQSGQILNGKKSYQRISQRI